MNNFTKEEKIALFDQIAAKYYDRNFGTMLKADIDTLIFSAYIEHCLDNDLPYDDYTLSKQLGITETRIRALKERKELQYPRKGYEWREAFVKLIPNAKYNDVKKLVQLNIGDVNLLKDVRNFIYSKGWYDEFQLNPKLFQCRLDYFICLCRELGETEAFTKETEKALRSLGKNEKERSAIEKLLTGSFEDGIKEVVVGCSKELLAAALELLPFGGIAQSAIGALINVLRK